MNHYFTYLKTAFIVTTLVISLCAFAIDSPALEKKADQAIEQLYHRLKSLHKPSMPDRIDWISAQFLGKPYLLGALGEGQYARYDQFPKYQTDAFDCETYVTTVLAIALAENSDTFEQCLTQIRYKKGKRAYINRNHFTSLDWNGNNQNQGFIQDITLNITNQNNQPVAQTASALINKPNWYQHKTLDNIRLTHKSHSEKQIRLEELKHKGKRLTATEAKIPYLPLHQLFDANGRANIQLFKQIPNGAIVEIVRPNWNLNQSIGTCLNVSHLGFAIWSKDILYFREASSKEGKVVDIPMVDYLKSALKSPTIKGINLQKIRVKQPLNAPCIP